MTFQAHEATERGKTGDGALNGALNGALKQTIYAEISANPGLQRKDLIEMLDVPTLTLARAMKDLQERGLIEHRGSKKTGGYFVLGEEAG